MADETAESKPETCPRCGMDLSKREAPPSEEDKKEYIRAVLGDRTFKKTYAFLDGALKVTFRELTAVETVLLYDAVRGMPPDDSVMVKAVQLKLMASTVEVSKGGKAVPGWSGQELGAAELASDYNRVFGPLPENVVGAVHSAFSMFTLLVRDVGSACMDKDF